MFSTRLRAAIEAGNEAIKIAEEASSVSSGLEKPRVGFLALGVELPASLQRIHSELSVLVTDKTNPELFKLPGLVTEYLPNPSIEEKDAKQRHQCRRLARIWIKWRLRKLYFAGDDAQELVLRWQSDGLAPEVEFFSFVSTRKLIEDLKSGLVA